MPALRMPPSTRRETAGKLILTVIVVSGLFMAWDFTLWTWLAAIAVVATMIASFWFDPWLDRAPFDKYNPADDGHRDSRVS